MKYVSIPHRGFRVYKTVYEMMCTLASPSSQSPTGDFLLGSIKTEIVTNN